MINYKLGKNPLQILRQISNSKAQADLKQVKVLKNQIRQYISQILDFNVIGQNPDKLVQLSRETKLNKIQLLELWSQSIMSQLKKFIFKLNTIAIINKSPSDKIVKEILTKLQKCSMSINKVISMIASDQNWCLCRRKNCLGRFDSQFTNDRIKNYVFSNLKIQNQWKSAQHLQNLEVGCLNFFNVQNDSQCNLITLETIQSKPTKVLINNRHQIPQNNEGIIKYLKNLKIYNSQRKDCFINSEWIEQLQLKFNKQSQF